MENGDFPQLCDSLPEGNDPIFGFGFWIRVLWVNNKGLNDSMGVHDSTHMDLMTQFLWVRFWIAATIGKWSKL